MLLQNTDNITDEHPIGTATIQSLGMLTELCQQIPSLNHVLDQVNRCAQRVHGGVAPIILHNDLENLQHRILEELKRHYYYPVTEGYAAIYANPAPWGEDVYNNFPSARIDITNSAKCIILGQGTAGVFHLMRVMEVGLKLLGREAGINYAPSWEAYFSQIETKMKVKHADKPVAWKRKEPMIKELVGDLSMIKIAWRNPTMHIVREYSVTDAEQVYNAVRTFMQRMATKFKERGRPIAVSIALASSAVA